MWRICRRCRFNDDYSVTQFLSSDKADLEKLRNSKYVQSDSQGFFKQVQELLKAREKYWCAVFLVRWPVCVLF